MTIQPKKHGNRKNVGMGVEGARELGGEARFEKRGVGNISGSS